MRYLLFILFTFSAFLTTDAQNLSPQEILKRSIAYHDPQGKMFDHDVTLYMTETRPNGSDRKSQVSFDLKQETFSMQRSVDGLQIHSYLEKGKASFTVDGKSEISDEVKNKYRLEGDRLNMLKDYYQYLWLLPMKLNDPGTHFNPQVKTIDFFGKKSLEIRVTYDPNVGGDVWYFYFNPKTFALQGYRFYHEEEKNDGEYILLDNEVSFNGVRLPKERKWYTHKEDKFLGTDILDRLEF